jgi:hypothetical protein
MDENKIRRRKQTKNWKEKIKWVVKGREREEGTRID